MRGPAAPTSPGPWDSHSEALLETPALTAEAPPAAKETAAWPDAWRAAEPAIAPGGKPATTLRPGDAAGPQAEPDAGTVAVSWPSAEDVRPTSATVSAALETALELALETGLKPEPGPESGAGELWSGSGPESAPVPAPDGEGARVPAVSPRSARDGEAAQPPADSPAPAPDGEGARVPAVSPWSARGGEAAQPSAGSPVPAPDGEGARVPAVS
ncbi:hypothetical protein J7E93_24865, partial [Streptomyces sp. ISL-36]|nr:hypothetical protein [Streptomyces sp. ISL-36]